MTVWKQLKNSNIIWVIGILGSIASIFAIFLTISHEKFGETKITQSQANYWYNKGLEMFKRRKYEQALESYNRAIKRPNFYQAWFEKGKTLGLLHRYEDALEAFDMAIAIKSDFAAPWLSKGQYLFDLGRYEESLEALNKATDIKPDYAVAWYEKGSILYYLGQFKDALEAFNKAIEIKQGITRIGLVILRKGYTLIALGRMNEALEAFKKVTESNSFYVPHAWYAKARLYSIKKDKSNALRCLRKTIQCKHFELEYLKNDTHFNFIRNEKEFQSLFSN